MSTVTARRAMREMKKMAITTLGAGVEGKFSASKPRLRAVSGKFAALRAHNERDGGLEWFIVNLLNKSYSISCPCGSLHLPQQIYRSFDGDFMGMPSCATLGSTLYCLGGSDPRVFHTSNLSNQVSMLDATCPDHGFKEGPSMINGRENAFTVPLRGKLYVFGGGFPDKEPFAECFDPKKNKWEPISEPPIANAGSMPLHPVLAIPYGKTDIILSFMPSCCPKETETVFIYHTESDSWGLYPNPIPLDFGSHNPVKVGDTLYSIQGMFVYAYDLSSHQSYSGLIKGSVPPVMPCFPSFTFNQHLFHIGGNQFCFFDLHFPSSDPPSSVLHCTKIRLVKKDSGDLNATTISAQSYLVDHCLEFLYGMPLDRRFVGNFYQKSCLLGVYPGKSMCSTPC